MTATKPLGTYGNAVGTVTPLDHKMAQSGLIVKTAANTIRAGLFWDGSATIVSGKANMSYDVRAYTAATSRGATLGTTLLTNDAVYNVVTTAAPGSNSRYDVVYHWPREYSIDGVDSNPVIGVVQGTPAASPSVPSLAAFPGAVELARILVPTGVTATNTGTTITQTAPFTATAGGTVVVRNPTERDAGSWMVGQRIYLIDSGAEQIYTGSAWAAGNERVIGVTNGTGTIVAGAFAAIPTSPCSIIFTPGFAAGQLVRIKLAFAGICNAGTMEVGTAVSGATTLAADQAWTGAAHATVNGSFAEVFGAGFNNYYLEKVVFLAAGANTITVQARIGGAGGTKQVASMFLTAELTTP